MSAGARVVDTAEVWPFIVGFSIVALAIGIAFLFGFGATPTAQGAALLASSVISTNPIRRAS